MHLELTRQQRNLLWQLVDQEVRELGTEIRHTDSRTYKDDLKERRGELRGLLEVLAGEAGPAAHAPSADRESSGLVGTP